MLGRAGGLLVDVAIDTVPRGYRIGCSTRRGDTAGREPPRRGYGCLRRGLGDAGLRGCGRAVKVQAPGPVTLVAGLELANGHRAITDPGAVRDLAASLAEGVAAHRAAAGAST
ncbi:hypothetical protein [Mycobacterium tuberculosis]|uniref:hypothetical protein n=1 Tax=Mycobacterium tuberculosis TaxID=1773 RepID=UPI0039E9D511